MAKSNSLTSGKAATPSDEGPAVSPSAARAAADVILATQQSLTIWMAAAHVGSDLSVKLASDLQNAAWAIDESMQDAEGTCTEFDDGRDFQSARHLIRMIDMALWNFQSSEIDAPDTGDLIGTADMALGRLVSLSLKLGALSGGVQ